MRSAAIVMIGVHAALVIAGLSSSVALAQTIGGTVNLTASSGTFHRPEQEACGSDGGVVHYTTVEFVVDVTGVYTFRTLNNEEMPGHVDDPFLVVYESPFDPVAPAINCLNANDDSNDLESELTLSLATGTIYTAVITTFGDGATGLIEWSASGTGGMFYVISVKKAVTSDPTPNGGTLTLQLSDADFARWVALPSGSAAPSPAQIVAGEDSVGAAALTSGSLVVAQADADVTASITGLASNTQYDIYVVAFNSGFGSGVRKVALTTLALAGPVLVSSLPASGTVDVEPGSAIVLTFDSPISLGTGFIDIDNQTDETFERIDVSAPGSTLGLSDGNTVLTIAPEIPLVPGKTYDVVIEAGAIVGDNGPFDGIQGTALQFSTVAADAEPDGFSLQSQTGLPPASLRTSNAIVVSGINVPTPISVTNNGSYSVNAGTPSSSPSTVRNGDVVRAYLMTSSTLSETETLTLTIGGVDAQFSVTTGDRNRLVVGDNFLGDENICSEGGVRLFVGNDYDGDGELAEEEIDQTLYLCNGRNAQVQSQPLASDENVCASGGVQLTIGVPGLQTSGVGPSSSNNTVVANVCNGLASLVATSEIAAGDAGCANGGTRITHWLDQNGDGEVTQGEDQVSQRICNGLTTLVQTTSLSQDPAVCPHGGIRVRAGTDANGTGLLDAGEIATDEVICHGKTGLVEASLLEPEAKECSSGGLKIDSGIDDDGNGTLDVNEIGSSRKLCNAPAMVSRTTEVKPMSKECAYGGSRLESGVDTDGDHELDDDEVSSTALICNGTNLAVRTSVLHLGSKDCPAGGVAIESGVDTNGSGTLDASEASMRDVVCKPPQLLFETETIEDHDGGCAHGGLRVTSGYDDGKPSGVAGDGKLQPGEVALDDAICLAPTDVLVSGGSGSCTVTPGQRGSTATFGWMLLGLLGITVSRRRRRIAMHRNTQRS
jgi:MYXO-CTERM domain-containing protein